MSLQSSINELETLLKAGPRGGKYYRRVPTGNPKRPWRYYYSKEQYDRAHGDGAHVNGDEASESKKVRNQVKALKPGDKIKIRGEEYSVGGSPKRTDKEWLVGLRNSQGLFIFSLPHKGSEAKVRNTGSVFEHKVPFSQLDFLESASTGKASAEIEDEGDSVEKGFGPNWDSRCLIHGRDLHKASFHEPYATCSCPK